MIRFLRLLLFLALTSGAAIAPNVSLAKVSDVTMAQMNIGESAEKICDGCVSLGFAGGILCEGGCPVACGSSGTTGILTRTPTAPLPMSLGVAVPETGPLIPLGANPSLDPFPPKTPV